MSGKSAATDEDIRLGKLLQISRVKMGFSQKDLANKVGITFQQIQKYETGQNRIATSRLIEIADALGVPVSQLLGETYKPYTIDKKMGDLISRIYTMPESKRKLIYSMVKELTNGTRPIVKKPQKNNYNKMGC